MSDNAQTKERDQPAACCPPTEQESCCEPSEKSTCCGPAQTATGSCGCN